MIFKNIFLLFISLSIFMLRADAQNDVLFTLDNSPYHLTEDLVLEESASLTIEAGVIVYLDSMVNISLSGNLIAEGTVDNPIQFLNYDNYKWGILEVKPNASLVNIQHTSFINGRLKLKCQKVSISESEIDYNYPTIFGESLVVIRNAETVVDNFMLTGYSDSTIPNLGDGILVISASNPIISNSDFSNTSDAVEFINCIGGEISNNNFRNIDDDAIDLNNCQNIGISSNNISYVADRAMEIGSENFGASTNINILRNIIYYCSEGVSIRQESSGIIENNTFYANQLATNIIRDVNSEYGSSAEIINCIYNENEEDVFIDEYSEAAIKNCLTDNTLFSGENNIIGDPLFINPEEYDFHLDTLSPCIDSGYKLSPLDPDNTIADIGALYRHQDISSFTYEALNIFPNPFSDKVIIQLNSPANYVSIDVYDLSGKPVLSREYTTLSLYIQLELSFLNAGTYIFKISQDQASPEHYKAIKL